MNNRLLMLDLDGTVRTTNSGAVTPQYPADQMVLERTAIQLEKYKRNGWDIVGISNQGGCEAINPNTGKPYKARRQVILEMRYLLKLAPDIDRVYFCPNCESHGNEVYIVKRPWWAPYWLRVVHEYADEHPAYIVEGYRKPMPGMLELARSQYRDASVDDVIQAFAEGVDRTSLIEDAVNSFRCLMVGDQECDQIAAKKAGVVFIPAEDWRKGWPIDWKNNAGKAEYEGKLNNEP